MVIIHQHFLCFFLTQASRKTCSFFRFLFTLDHLPVWRRPTTTATPFWALWGCGQFLSDFDLLLQVVQQQHCLRQQQLKMAIKWRIMWKQHPSESRHYLPHPLCHCKPVATRSWMSLLNNSLYQPRRCVLSSTNLYPKCKKDYITREKQVNKKPV